MERELTILTYHRVAELPPGVALRGLYVTPAQFAWQLGQIARAGVRVVTFGSPRGAGDETDAPRLMLTFDDGSADFFQSALPLLRWHGFPAVVFPVQGDIGGQGVAWEESTESTAVDLLDGAQLQALQAEGIEIGSHLVHHVHATRLTPEQQGREMRESRERLGALLGSPPQAVAYPYGDHDDSVVAAAAEAGYRYGLTMEPGSNRGGSDLRLHRLAVKGTRWYHRGQFRRMLRRCLNPSPPL